MICATDNATVRRGGLTALSGVSLTIAAGERVALLGHNGAGKTTLMHALLGLVPLSGGHINVAGAAAGSRAARAATAYLPENVAFHPALTGHEQLAFFGRLRGCGTRRVSELLARVGLAPAARRRIATYSKGMRQRLGLAQALLERPALALLDEPTTGLDPLSRSEFYRLVEEMAAAGTAVLISSHALAELESQTERILLLRAGHLVADETLAELRARAALPIRLRVTARPEAAADVAAMLGGERVNGEVVELTCVPERKLAVLGRISGLGPRVRDVELSPAGLEDLYRYFNTEPG